MILQVMQEETGLQEAQWPATGDPSQMPQLMWKWDWAVRGKGILALRPASHCVGRLAARASRAGSPVLPAACLSPPGTFGPHSSKGFCAPGGSRAPEGLASPYLQAREPESVYCSHHFVPGVCSCPSWDQRQSCVREPGLVAKTAPHF